MKGNYHFETVDVASLSLVLLCFSPVVTGLSLIAFTNVKFLHPIIVLMCRDCCSRLKKTRFCLRAQSNIPN